jgi:RNA polymerase sigma-70 factor (ECF subfamily)
VNAGRDAVHASGSPRRSAKVGFALKQDEPCHARREARSIVQGRTGGSAAGHRASSSSLPGMTLPSAASAADGADAESGIMLGKGGDGHSHTPERDGAEPSTGRATAVGLYREWGPVVYSAARALLPCDDDAEDAVQRVFLRFLRRRNGVPKTDRPMAYFRLAGRREALLLLRSGQRHVPIAEPLTSAIPSRAPLPDRLLHVEQARARLKRLADALPTRCGAVMKLRLDGASNPDIARALGILVKAVEKQAARGRTLLDETLALRGYRDLSHFLDRGGKEV